jgi:hypothetical protein
MTVLGKVLAIAMGARIRVFARVDGGFATQGLRLSNGGRRSLTKVLVLCHRTTAFDSRARDGVPGGLGARHS